MKPRPAEEMKELADQFYEDVGIDPPAPEYTEIWYFGDGKHYPTNKPMNEEVCPPNRAEAENRKKANKGKWGVEVDVSADAYAKISKKDGTRNQVCLGKLTFFDVTGICIGSTPATWSAVPDSVQARRFGPKILQMLTPWMKGGKLLCAGGFDGGFYSNVLATRLRWVTPFPEDHIQRNEANREFFKKHNDFIRTIRGPIAEGGFAIQVNNLKIFSERWRFDFPFHDEIYNLAQALLNINRLVA